MKRCNQIPKLLLAVLITALLLSGSAVAAGSIDRDCSLTISYRDDGIPVSGAGFSLYLAATVDASGSLRATEVFSRFPVRLRGQDDGWKALASTLEGYVLRDNLAPTGSGVTDAQGQLSFPSGGQKLTPGLYLVLGSRSEQNGRVYDPQPFLVMLPTMDKESGNWIYQVRVSPKYEVRPDVPGVVSRKALKVWRDEGQETNRPKDITVQLLRDGKVYDTVTLNAENSWRYVWEELDSAFRWTLVEEAPEDYTVEITREGAAFLVVNTWDGPDSPETPTEPDSPETPTEPGSPELPYTGQLWWPAPLLLCAGLACIVVGLIRRRGACHEAHQG